MSAERQFSVFLHRRRYWRVERHEPHPFRPGGLHELADEGREISARSAESFRKVREPRGPCAGFDIEETGNPMNDLDAVAFRDRLGHTPRAHGIGQSPQVRGEIYLSHP